MKFTLEKTEDSQKILKYKFHNLTDLYEYLKTEPRVNKNIFKKQASLDDDIDFNGESLDIAIEYLQGGYKMDFEKFDIATRSVRALGYEDLDSRKLVRGISGGSYLAPLVAADIPNCMIRYERDTSPKHITVYFQLAYPWITKPEQVFNRGIATINLIQSLQDKGYIVDLKVFELAECGNEYLDITVNVKNIDERLNITKCYYPFVGKEFLRRVLFRVLESAPVNNNWNQGYGSSLNKTEIRNFYNLKKRDIVISAPNNIGIEGMDIYSDTIALYENLELDKEFDLSKLKQKVKRRNY